MHCTEVKKRTYPPRNVRKSKKGSHNNNCTALKSKRLPILPETFANPKKVRTQLHCTEVKKYLSSKKRSQIQKRFAQQLHCTEVKKSTYPPRNVCKSKKGSHNSCTALKSKRVPILPETFANPKKVRTCSCTALKSKRVPILPETFANPKKVRTTVALHWSQKEYLSSQKRLQIQKRFAQQLHCTEVKKSTYQTFANPKKVHTTVALHWSKKEYLSSQKRSQIQKKVRTLTIALHRSYKEYLSSQKRSQIQKKVRTTIALHRS